MGFGEVAAQVFSLYGREEYEQALGVVQGARRDYPDEDNDLTFWEACLLGRAGRPAEALRVLSAGLDRGEWWAPGILTDEDLDPLRELPGWESVLGRCAAIADERLAHRPSPVVRPADMPAGTVVAIQGAQAHLDEVAARWAAATPDDWTVVTPAASEPEASGGWAWPHSIEESAVSVKRDMEPLSPHPPLVLTGFSIGSAIACRLATSRALPVDGLILVAPSSRSGFDEVRQAVAQGIPALVMGGDQDMRHDQYERLREDIADAPHVTMEILAGLGHDHPSDLALRVSDFLGALDSPTTTGGSGGPPGV